MNTLHLKKQQGFGVLVIILTLVIIISLISFVALRGTDSNNLLANSSISNNIVAQASLIRSRILACAIEYPAGNNGTSYRPQYPAASTATNVSNLNCPGANANIWTLLDGLNYPKDVDGFGNWQYINDGTSLRIFIITTDSNRNIILQKIASTLGPQSFVSNGNTLNWTIVQ